jgi:hypothetical protein
MAFEECFPGHISATRKGFELVLELLNLNEDNSKD